MRTSIRNILLVAFATLASFHVSATTVPHDTIYFYATWQQIFDVEPVAMVVDPVIDAVTPYEVYIETGIDRVNDQILNSYVALSQGDSIWLINCELLREFYDGDVKNLNGFAPFFFDEKSAFIVAPKPLTVKDVLLGNNDGVTTYSAPNYYYIDFLHRSVNRVTHNYLSNLLECYHDLQMRYEGMKDYKKDYVIEDYFFKFIDRLSQDPMQPYILDLVNE